MIATPAGDAAPVLHAMQPELAGLLADIPYSTSITLSLGYRKNTFDHPLIGHGFLVPKKERRHIFGCTWVGNKFDYRVPPNMVVLRCFLSGDAMSLGDQAIVDAARADLNRFMNLEAEPVFHNIARWPHSMAQYTVGHEKRVARIEELSGPSLAYISPAMHITASVSRIAFAWARKPPRPSSPDINPSFCRRNLDPVHIARQIERLVDFGFGIKRTKEILHQKIERCSSDRKSADFHPHHMHRRAAVCRLNAGSRLHQLLALNQLSDQPIGLDSIGMPHLEEIDQGSGCGLAVAQDQLRLAKSIGDHAGRLHSNPGVQLRGSESKHRTGLGFAALDQIQPLTDARRHWIGSHEQRRAHRS